MSRPAVVVIDVAAARANLAALQAHAPGCRIMAVVKADAYGHGLVRMARAFAGADALGVASLDEALSLRAAGITQRIVLLEGVFCPADVRVAAQERFDLVVHQWEQIELLRAWQRPDFQLWFKIDTGMHRLGFLPDRASAAYAALLQLDCLAAPPVLMTHLANANARDRQAVAEQVAAFDALTTSWSGEQSIANSAAGLAFPETRRQWLRPGLALYGVEPFEPATGADFGLTPVMSLRSALIDVRELPAGARVGYGGGFVCPEAMRVGVVAMGYGDGYPYSPGAELPVLVAGMETRVVGRVSMDMLSVDLRGIPEARIGSPVELWGRGIAVTRVAEQVGCIPYSLLCAAGLRAPRVEQQAEVMAVAASMPAPVARRS